MRKVLVLLALFAATPALAAPRPPVKKAKRAKVKKVVDVAGAVAAGTPDRLCGAAIELASAGDLARAGLLIGSCAGLPERAAAAKVARTAIDKAAAKDEWSPVEIVLTGKGADGAVVVIDAFADVPLAAGPVRLPAGAYVVTARTAGGDVPYELTLTANSRAMVMIAPAVPPDHTPRDAVLDFGSDDDGAPMDAPIAGPPTVKHGSLLPDRFLKGLKNCGAMACRQK